MTRSFDPGYFKEPFSALADAYPGEDKGQQEQRSNGQPEAYRQPPSRLQQLGDSDFRKATAPEYGMIRRSIGWQRCVHAFGGWRAFGSSTPGLYPCRAGIPRARSGDEAHL